MLVERKVFEKMIIQIVSSTDIRELIKEFSLRRVLFYSLLKDISKGKDSPHYHVLKKVAQDKKIDEQFIVERTKSILSYLASDARHLLVLPIVVSSPWMEIASRKFIYSVSLIAVVFAVIFYLTKSGLLFHTAKKEKSMEEIHANKPKTEEKVAGPSSPRESKIIAAEEETKEVPKPKELKASKYVVKGGDNLWDIAKRFNVSVRDIKNVNKLKSNRLNIGDVLVIPKAKQKRL